MREPHKQSGSAHLGRTSQPFIASTQPQEPVRFDWRWKTPPSERSWFRAVQRKLGGLIAYSVTFYRTAAK